MAVGRVAEIAKRIIAQHYARSHLTIRKLAGCSTGGREGMLMAERYPAFRRHHRRGAGDAHQYSGIGDRWVAVTLNEIAPKNAQGQPDTRNALSEGEKKAVVDGIVNACDANDGPGTASSSRQRVQVRSEDAGLPRAQDRQLPLDRAGDDGGEGVHGAEGLQRPAGLSRVRLGHRPDEYARPARTAAGGRWSAELPRRWGWTSTPRSNGSWRILRSR